MKVYGLREQMLIVVPRGGDLKGILLRYASIFAIVALASIVLALLGPAFAPLASPVVQNALPSATRGAPSEAGNVADHLLKGAANETQAPSTFGVTPTVPEAATTAPGIPSLPLVFFLGGVLVIAVMLGYELWKWRRETKG